MIDPKTGEDYDPRPFDQTLREIAEGQANDELGEKLNELMRRVQATGKGGTLTLTLGVDFDGRGRVKVGYRVAAKLPEHGRPETSFFVKDDGNPSRRDPNQPEIPGVIQLHTDKNGTDQ